MRQLLIGIVVSIAASVGAATECQNLTGKFFFSNMPQQSVTIEQSGCVVTMIYSHSGGTTGKPLEHRGDGVWRLTYENKYERELQASFAKKDSFVVETKTERKQMGVGYHLIENYQLRADGNILLKSSIQSEDIYDSAARLLIRE